MAIHVFVLVLIALLGVVVVASALAFWTQILQWAEASLFPWVERNLPFLADSVRQAFVELDRVAVPLRLLARRAWATVRERLLKMTVTIERHSDNEWVHRVTSWVVKVLDNGKEVPVKVETEERVDWDDLPLDVRDAFLRRQRQATDMDVTEVRDRELAEMALTE